MAWIKERPLIVSARFVITGDNAILASLFASRFVRSTATTPKPVEWVEWAQCKELKVKKEFKEWMSWKCEWVESEVMCCVVCGEQQKYNRRLTVDDQTKNNDDDHFWKNETDGEQQTKQQKCELH